MCSMLNIPAVNHSRLLFCGIRPVLLSHRGGLNTSEIDQQQHNEADSNALHLLGYRAVRDARIRDGARKGR